MKNKRPAVDKLRKVEAVIADRGATDGEKAAAGEAAARIRMKRNRERVEAARAALQANPLYLLGRALRHARDATNGDPTQGSRGVMYSFGRAWRKVILKR